MLLRQSSRRRSGAHAVECAIIYPVVFFLVFGIFIGGLGVFRYQQMSHLSRQAARFAAVHGGQYQAENAPAIAAGQLPNVDEAYLRNMVLANAVSMDPSKLTVQVFFNTAGGSTDWDAGGTRYPYTENSTGTANQTNTVTVIVTYKWFPELYLFGPITLTSKSVMPMSY